MMRSDRLDRVPWVAVAVFVVSACVLAWGAALPLWLTGGSQSPLLGGWLQLVGMAMMFTPALATVLVVFVLRVPRGARLRFLGMWPLRPAKRVIWFTVAALFVPPLIVAMGVFVSAALGFATLDLVSFSGFQALIDAQLAALDPAMRAEAGELPPVGLIVALQLLSIPVGGIVNSVFAFGEEVGWRGWLLPALLPLGTWPALIISGVVWGLWHSPLILLGYDFGFIDWRGVALMVAGCVAWGAVLGWSRLRTGSVWPAVFGHGALNAAAGLGMLLAAAGSDMPMWIVGPLGAVVWVLIAVLMVVLVLTGQFKAQPELALAAQPVAIPPDQPELGEH